MQKTETPHHSRRLVSHEPPADYIRCERLAACAARRAHHIKDELVDVEVGILLHAADDAALDHAAAALHLQARGGDARQLEAFQVTDAPRYDLRDRTGKKSFFTVKLQRIITVIVDLSVDYVLD